MLTRERLPSHNVAPDRPVYELDERYIDELAELVKEGAKREKDVARLAWALNKALTFREMEAELRRRGASPFSYSWLARLAKVWGFWVVKHQYSPDEIFSYSRTKLYMMAAKDFADLDFLKSRAHLSDGEFATELKRELGLAAANDGVFLRITRHAHDTLKEQAERLQRLTGYAMNPASTAEFAAEMLAYLSDEAVMKVWAVLHGEYQPED